MLTSIFHWKNWKKSNTRVEILNERYASVWLHNTRISLVKKTVYTIDRVDKVFFELEELTNGGYDTRTTNSRLRNLIHTFTDKVYRVVDNEHFAYLGKQSLIGDTSSNLV